jgi:hypothetical protein
MTPLPDLEQNYEVECPHCHKPFTAQPVSGRAARYAGFKCPHCRLFVPFERIGEHEAPAGGEPA